MKNKGFTLIELLVVIAIIGILASIVLASLNTARSKGEDAAIKANLANIRAEAELYYDDNGNYYTDATTNVCTDTQVAAMVTAASTNAGDCDAAAGEWAAEGQLSDDSYWCVDSTGTSAAAAATKGASATVCG
ncbi:MAG: type II secretion system protein [Candidatus Paceibacterota bacterium]